MVHTDARILGVDRLLHLNPPSLFISDATASIEAHRVRTMADRSCKSRRDDNSII